MRARFNAGFRFTTVLGLALVLVNVVVVVAVTDADTLFDLLVLLEDVGEGTPPPLPPVVGLDVEESILLLVLDMSGECFCVGRKMKR